MRQHQLLRRWLLRLLLELRLRLHVELLRLRLRLWLWLLHQVRLWLLLLLRRVQLHLKPLLARRCRAAVLRRHRGGGRGGDGRLLARLLHRADLGRRLLLRRASAGLDHRTLAAGGADEPQLLSQRVLAANLVVLLVNGTRRPPCAEPVRDNHPARAVI